jgi:hypothetical protein
VSVYRGRVPSHLALILGVVTLGDVVLLLVQDAEPKLFPAMHHSSLAAFSLALIACGYLIFQLAHRRASAELLKAVLLVAAFLFWAANQYWPGLSQATLFNDIAIALFVFDIFLVLVGWPRASSESVFTERDDADVVEGDPNCCCNRGLRDASRGTCEAGVFDS